MAPGKNQKKFKKNFREKEKILKKFILLFRYGECPSGEFQYSIVWARSKQSAWGTVFKRYGNYAPFDVITEEVFNQSTVKAQGATLYEEIEEVI